MSFPRTRLRRLRQREAVRALAEEVRLSPRDLILPLFVAEGIPEPEAIPGMPGVERHTVKSAVGAAREGEELGIPGVIVFGIPSERDARGTGADARGGIAQRAVEAIKADTGVAVITDLCLCGYTDAGQCGLVTSGTLDDDATLERYASVAVSQAKAGADLVAPSGMMDGQVRAVREALDASGFKDVGILSYAAKFASSFYGPFREAAKSAPATGDRREHQLPPDAFRQAMREIALDVEEGADIVMVKPALAYLDVIRAARERFDVPLAAYNVSGEYAMVKAAAASGALDGRAAMLEILTAIRRAGAGLILTYHAVEAARNLAALGGPPVPPGPAEPRSARLGPALPPPAPRPPAARGLRSR